MGIELSTRRKRKMKILEITTLYPKESNKVKATEFLHEYNKEFIKNNENDIKVVFLSRKYPALFKYLKPLLLQIPVFKRKVSPYSTELHLLKDRVYNKDLIDVYELTITKYIPHGEFPKRELMRAKRKILKWLEQINFQPDVILLDFLNPCALMYDIFSPEKVFLIPHHTDISYVRKDAKYRNIASSIAAVLFRSYKQEELFMNEGLSPRKRGIILSGVPQCSIVEDIPKRKKISRFMTACRLTENKNVLKVIQALMKCDNQEWQYSIIGDGEMFDEIRNFIEDNNLIDKCHLMGWKNKHDVYKLMQQHDCFVMPSVGETFGMVYIEAMANGCIPLGSKNEGIDGVIRNGENGYLVDPNNISELTLVLDGLMSMVSNEIERCMEAALRTAKRLTNENLAHELESFLRDFVKENSDE